MRDNWLISTAVVFAVLAVGLLFFTGASGPPPGTPTVPAHTHTQTEIPALTADLRKLDARITANELEIAGIESASAHYARQADLAKAQSNIGSLASSVTALATGVTNNRANIGKLFAKDAALDKLVTTHVRILEYISQNNGNGYLPSIEDNMSVKQFRDEMGRVVSSSIHPTSTLIVTNKTSLVQSICINEDGPYWTLQPNQTAKFDRPTGNVSTRLRGQQLVNWVIGPPRYEQKIEIVTREGASTYTCR